MRTNPVRLTRYRLQRGMNLIEIMIALVLGIILLLGLVQIFGAVRTSFTISEASARVQENSRFALEFLRRDMRMAGNMGCNNEAYHQLTADGLNYQFNHFLAAGVATSATSIPPNSAAAPNFYPFRIDLPIEVYDYVGANGTRPGTTYTITSATPSSTASVADWGPDLPTALGIEGAATQGRVVPGSDVVVVRYVDELPLLINGTIDIGTGVVPVTAADVATMTRWAPYVMTNCRIQALFQASSLNATSFQIDALRNIQRAPGFWFHTNEQTGSGTIVSRFRMAVYYVGQGPNGPSLYRRRLVDTPTSADNGITLGAPEELIEGVDSMQALIGVDTANTDGVVEQFTTADLHVPGAASTHAAQFRQIAQVRLALLMRSPGSLGVESPTATQYLVNDTRINVPADRRLRQVYETVISLRNRVRS